MIGQRPNFMNSPFFVLEKGNWHLKEGAPKEVVDEFNEYMQEADDGFVNLKNIKPTL